MANIKSDKKSIVTNKKRNSQNSSFKSSLKTAIKNVEAAQTKEAGMAAYAVAVAKLDKAHAKGIVHQNYVNNQKSRLAKFINSLN